MIGSVISFLSRHTISLLAATIIILAFFYDETNNLSCKESASPFADVEINNDDVLSGSLFNPGDLNEAKGIMKKRLIMTLIIFIAALALLTIVFHFNSRPNSNRINHAGIIEELKSPDDMLSSSNNKLAKIVRNHFQITDRICYQYITHEGKQKAEEAVFKEVEQIIADVGKNEEQYSDLEAVLDESYDDIIMKFKAEFPKLKNDDYHLMAYWIAGFSNSVMATFLGGSIGSLYSKKSRLRKRIIDSDSKYKQQFLSVLK
ncbi:MAG: hypothetical protein LKI59_05665 [Bacteroidales bacterium]|jgi:hypothetical protein|nr:hypothetical protein [Bacteroidales bacterium]